MNISFKTKRLAALLFACLGGVLSLTGPTSPAIGYFPQRIIDNSSLRDVMPVADNQFATKEEAETYLSKTLPLATAANPKYRGEAGALTQWLTKSASFGPSKNPHGILVQMSEEVLNFKNGARVSTGSHEVWFQIEDVTVSLLTDSKDLTEAGDQTQGVIFRCAAGKCVTHKWNGVESTSDWTDISMQDGATRDKILAAFQALKRAAGG
jgi:hypothetical protein